MGPPGAVGGRSPPLRPFQGHRLSARLCPTGFPPGGLVLSKDAACAALTRPNFACHLAHNRSTLQWIRKNNGSFTAVGIVETEPPKLVCANPCGLPSRFRKSTYL